MFEKLIAFIMSLVSLVSGFIFKNYDTDFEILDGGISTNGVITIKEKTEIDVKDYGKEFNYYGIKYTSDSYLKCTFTYKVRGDKVNESFFLEPSETVTEFYSFIDDALERRTAKELTKLTIEPLNSEEADRIEV